MQLKGKTALISGAGRNSGRAIAINFAREGADLVLIAKERVESLNEVTKECESYGVKVLPLLADVGKPEEVSRVVQLGLERFGKVDTLVCVAALRNHQALFDYTNDEWLQTFSVNVHSTFYLAKALLPGMMERKSGNIIALGAVLSLIARPHTALETACKHGLYGLIKSIALDFGQYGIRANLLILGNIENKRANPERYPWEARSKTETSGGGTRTLLMGRMGTSQDVANVALFLASDRSSYITGDRIVCGGGKYM